jgi:hypothetical protein
MMLGYDWLEKFSSMKIHWSEKWMAIPYGSSTVVIHGILSQLSPGDAVQILQLSQEEFQPEKDSNVLLPKSLLPEIQNLLLQYADLFVTKVTFPPDRSCSHSIPLIPGARPVNIRPYRYAPALKNEIENQVEK